MSERDAPQLTADCSRCAGLCCVSLPFAASAEFAIDKAAGTPCPNLAADFRCGIHSSLRERGFSGCTSYDCFGAGQKVTQLTFRGVDWREDPITAPRMFEAFRIMRQVHELMALLAEALALEAAETMHGLLRLAFDELDLRTHGDASAVLAIEVTTHRDAVRDLLQMTSVVVRHAAGGVGPDRAGADLFGTRLRGADLRRADLRGATLVGADLRGADLRWADLLGADLRGARLDGADLTDALFLTQPQIDAARGDGDTVLPARVERPRHW